MFTSPNKKICHYPMLIADDVCISFIKDYAFLSAFDLTFKLSYSGHFKSQTFAHALSDSCIYYYIMYTHFISKLCTMFHYKF